jgi:O-antigen/teichoic acid export membrane protein
VEAYGTYVYVFNWLFFLLLFCRVGLGSASLRFVAGYAAVRDWSRLRGYLRTTQLLVGLASLVVAGATAAWVMALGERLDDAMRRTFLVACVAFPVFAYLQVWGYVLRGLKRVFVAQVPGDVLQPALLGGAALVFWLSLPGGLEAPRAMGLTIGSAVATLLVTAAGLRWALPAELRAAPSRSEPLAWLRVSLPILLINAVHISLQRADVLLIGSLLDTSAAALYASASRIAILIPFGLNAVNAWAAPLISDLHARGDRAGLQRLVRLGARAIFAVTVPVSLAVIGFGREVLGLFGPEFTQAYPALAILCVGQIVSALVGPVGFLMTMTGNQDAAAKILIVHAAVNVALNAVLIPRLGIEGAALATSLVRASWNLVLAVVVWRRMGLRATIL